MGNRIMRNRIALFVSVFLCCATFLCSVAWGQTQTPPSSSAPPSGQSGSSMPGMNMPGHDMSGMKDMPMDGDKEGESGAGASAMHSMEGHMDMGPHMKMTALRKPQPGDAERAQKVADEARKVMEYYADYHKALADGFEIFLPNIPQKIYHFTNYKYGREAFMSFNPEHPTSLLYEKHGDDYKLIGVMYTAPKRMTEDDLNERIPLSIAQWHEHVNFCRAPADMPVAERLKQSLGPDAKFGFKGSIHTQEACDAAGGRFLPVVFNWMVHVYPMEKDQAAIWSVDRQHGDAD
jgi:hypothetical protein